MKYNYAADKYLEELYDKVGAKTAQQKYNVLILALGYQNDTINFSHMPSWEQKQSMMEYDLLEKKQLITLTYC